MDCPEVQERLPWHMNGTLEPDEQEGLRRHLEACPACRDELAETRRAAAVFGAHLPPRAIVDLAFGRPSSGWDPGTVSRHLEACEPCSRELSDARESRRLQEEPRPARPSALRPWWGPASVAAAIVLGFATGVFWSSGRRSDDAGAAERKHLVDRLAEVSSEATRLRDHEAELRGRLESLEAPLANLPVVEVMPATATRRSGGERPPNEVVLSDRAPFVALVLDSTAPGKGPAVVEVRGADGTVLWRVSGLEPAELGGYTLALPTARLPDGKVTLVVSAEGTGAGSESYVLNVRRIP